MTDRTRGIKRRKHKRFQVVVDAVAESESKGHKLGKVINISLNGFAVQSPNNPAKKKKPLLSFMKQTLRFFSFKDPLNLSIRTECENNCRLKELPCQIVADFKVPTNPTLSQCCFNFGPLRHDQLFHLKSFIKDFTGEVMEDRRCGKDRRRYDSPQFHAYIQRNMDRRKWWKDRRQSITG